MSEFKGCFKQIARPYKDIYLETNGFVFFPAPNRYRKLLTDKGPNPTSPNLTGALVGEYDNALCIEMQSKEFDLPNPIGFEFDLFDTYIAWELDVNKV